VAERDLGREPREPVPLGIPSPEMPRSSSITTT